MKLALRFLGIEFFSVELVGDSVEYAEELEPGDCVSFPVGFIANHEKPDDVGLPDRWNY